MSNFQDPVEIFDYDPQWRSDFIRVGKDLREALGSRALRIDHIGSTSVVGLAAKPIIDIQISVGQLEPVESYRSLIEKCGFEWRRDNLEKTKRYFREMPGSQRTHIHVRKAGSWNEQFALLFRDYIRAHRAEQELYEAIKRELALKHRNQRSRYVSGKDPIFWEIMQRANTWACAEGWEPGAPDI